MIQKQLICNFYNYLQSCSTISLISSSNVVFDSQPNIDLSNLKIYQDVDVSECAICLTNEKNTIFNPCGHFYCCDVCSKQIKSCPICRTNITASIHKNLVDV